jgi:hypothetical protein
MSGFALIWPKNKSYCIYIPTKKADRLLIPAQRLLPVTYAHSFLYDLLTPMTGHG